MDVTVVIPCHNAEKYLAEAVESALGQKGVSSEVIVVDDGSSDSSAGIITRDFPSVKLIRSECQGPSRARNLGTRHAGGAFIQYLDADDILAPDKIRIQKEALEKSPADVAYGDWLRLKHSDKKGWAPSETIRRQMRIPEIDLFTDFWCPPAAYLFRKEIVDRIGGWKEEFPIIQDARFVLDCALYGARFAYCPGVMASYRAGQGGSVSARDPRGFIRDCFRNAKDVEAWWRGHNGITAERRQALIKAYSYVMRSSFEKDREAFEEAFGRAQNLVPDYLPDQPAHFRVTAKIFGYRNAERIALIYRKCRKRLEKLVRKT
ncbi:MAG: glycosyltransferase [Candidatus Omnitrophota bacterium]